MTQVQNNAVEQDAAYSSMPLFKHERIWSAFDFTWVSMSVAIATWTFLTGGATVLLVGFGGGLAATLIGNAVGMGIMIFGSVFLSQRLGVEQYRALKSVFGAVGVAVIVITVVATIEMGWSSLLGVMFGRGVTEIANQAFGASLEPNGVVVTLLGLLAIIAAWFILSRGPIAIGRLNKFVAPGLLIIVVLMLALLLTSFSVTDLLDAKPLAPFEDDRLNFAIAVEFNVAGGLAWWPVMGSMARLTRGPRAAMWPAFAGLFAGTLIAQVTGMASALLIGNAEPTSWMVPVGGPIIGVCALLFVAFANVTSIAAIGYSTVLAIKQTSESVFGRLRWSVLCAIFMVLPAVLAFFPDFMHEQFMTFVVLSGAAIAAVCGVVVADYFVLRRQAVPLRALYATGSDDPLRFTGGVNIAAMVSIVAGSFFYLFVYNPVTLAALPVFELTTASIPTFVVAGLVYVPLCSLLYVRRNLGGYRLASPFAMKTTEG